VPRISVVGGLRSKFVSARPQLRLLLLPPQRRNPVRRSRTDGVEIAQSCDRFSLHPDEIARGLLVQSIVCIGVCREQHHRARSSIVIPDRSDPVLSLPYLTPILAMSFINHCTVSRSSITVEISYRAVHETSDYDRGIIDFESVVQKYN